MEFPAQPHARPFGRPQVEPRREGLDLGLLKRPLPFVVAAILVVSLACTLARLIIVAIMFHRTFVGIPALCYGAAASLKYGKIDTATAFFFKSISNAIAVDVSREGEQCRTTDYSLGIPDRVMLQIYIYLCVISVWNIFDAVFIQGDCWYRLITKGCMRSTFKKTLVTNFLTLGCDSGSIYMGSRRMSLVIYGLSAMILVCNFLFLVLNISVLRSQRNRGKDRRDLLEVATPELYDILNVLSDRIGRSHSTHTRRDLPNMVTMYNPRNG